MSSLSKWITAICAILGLIIAWGQAQPQICAAQWVFPFCLDQGAAAATTEDARDQAPPPIPAPEEPPCPPMVATAPAQAPRLLAPPGPGGSVDVVFMIADNGSAEVRSVVSSHDSAYNDLAVAFVRQSRWPTYAGGSCNAPYLAHYTVTFASFGDTKPDFYGASPAASYRTREPVEPQPIRTTIEIERLSQRAIARFYPARALERGINGLVELDCIVLSSRRLACTPSFESPRHQSFADAALRVAATVRVREDDSGFPTGARFTLPVRFHIAEVERFRHYRSFSRIALRDAPAVEDGE